MYPAQGPARNGESIAAWSPLPFPSRPPAFYSLKSVAFTQQKQQATDGTGGSARLPRISARGENRGLSARSGQSAESKEQEVHAQLLRRRDAALADYYRVEAQLQQTNLRTCREQKACANAREETKQLLEKADTLGSSLSKELWRIRSQQQTLRYLRERLATLQGQAGDRASSKLPVGRAAAVGSTGRVSQAGRPRQKGGAEPAQGAAPRFDGDGTPGSQAAEGAGADEPHNLLDDGASLDALLAEMQQVKEVFDSVCTAPHPADGGNGGSQMRSGRGSCLELEEDEEEEEAEIRFLRPGGIPLAQMWHPTGSEVMVDLRDCHVYSCHFVLPCGVHKCTVTLLWPSLLEDRNAPAWHLVQVDDSNNEPTITMSCGGDGGKTPWCVRRTLTLSAASLREDITVENLSSDEISLDVVEKAADPDAQEGIAKELKEMNSAHEEIPGCCKSINDLWPQAVRVPAAAVWSATRSWSVEDGAPSPLRA